jgi:hypothetical protein
MVLDSSHIDRRLAPLLRSIFDADRWTNKNRAKHEASASSLLGVAQVPGRHLGHPDSVHSAGWGPGPPAQLKERVQFGAEQT